MPAPRALSKADDIYGCTYKFYESDAPVKVVAPLKSAGCEDEEQIPHKS